MAERVTVRRPSGSDASSRSVDDLTARLDEERTVKLRVQAGQELSTTGVRTFKVAAPLTDEIELRSGVPNVIPHGLGKRVTEVYATMLGSSPAVGPSLQDLSEVTPSFDPDRFVCLRVTSTRTYRLRVR